MKLVVLSVIVLSVHAARLSLPSVGWMSSGTGSEHLNSVSVQSGAGQAQCIDGVCSIDGRANTVVEAKDGDSLSQRVLSDWASADGVSAEVADNTPAVPIIAEATAEQVQTLTDMGWSEIETKEALVKCDNDTTKAAQFLEAQDDEYDARRGRLRALVDSGWDQNAAYFILEKCEGNATAAAELLQQEEDRTKSNFNLAVKDMVANGWSELVAREALLAQWNVDQRKVLGDYVTESVEAMQNIFPTLRSANQTSSAKAATLKGDATAATSTGTGDTKSTSKGSTPALPTPAKKEDVVFDVTASTFQKIVLESPVPVLLDVYADWCGPCKQLGPVLEQAAIKAGGMFRLAKVNSDQERVVAEALQVTGLPTVFTVKQGKLNDKFVGMLPQEQLQQFLVRAVTGFGERVQGKEVSEQDLADTTSAVRILAGMSSIDFKKKEKLNTLVAQALLLEGAFTETGSSTSAALSEGVKTALVYINNAQKDVANAKFRSINTTNVAYVERILPSPAALRLLDIAGFKAAGSAVAGPLKLVHSNAALLTLVVQRVNEVLNDRRFSRMKSSAQDMPSKTSRSYRRPVTANSATPATRVSTSTSTSSNKVTPPAPKAHNAARKHTAEVSPENDTVSVAMRFASAGGVLSAKPRTVSQPKRTLLRHTIEALVSAQLQDSDVAAGTDIAEGVKGVDFGAVEITFPLPRRRLSHTSPELDRSLEELAAAKGGKSLSLAYLAHENSSTRSPSAKKTSMFSRLKSRSSKGKSASNKDKAHTLFSTGLLAQNKQKNNEYFGGDSTVVSAGEDSEAEVEAADDAEQ